ncbi:hypothetical protein [Citrobacter freundii]|uniref:hypothetical protein n=1 Tax=Citrobacter freundii TaxID=546 RepID=UPI0019084A46|nr:hypothetical protein [Citrobacter freundii]MBJ8931643.1 hypothetical protein [Citrobacter freundii]
MQLQNVSSDELESLGFSDDEITLISTADPIPISLSNEPDYSDSDGEPIFNGVDIICEAK